MKIILGLLLLTVILIVNTFIRRFSLVKVEGISMLPTFKDGQVVLMDRKQTPKEDIVFEFREDYLGECFIIINPISGAHNIKRLTYKERIEGSFKSVYWFEGDNKEHSYDSRDYGMVSKDYIVGKVVPFSDLIKTAFKF